MPAAANRFGRVACACIPVDHAASSRRRHRWCAARRAHWPDLMLPKPRGPADVSGRAKIDHFITPGARPDIPVHALVEIARRAAQVARSRRAIRASVVSVRADGLRLGAHGGAIPPAMGVRGQFCAPAGGARQTGDRRRPPCPGKGAVALRGHRVPEHRLPAGRAAERAAASLASRACGAFTRQIRTIVDAFSPPRPSRPGHRHPAGGAAALGAIRHADTLHDRASYRYFWQESRRLAQLPAAAPAEVRQFGSRALPPEPSGDCGSAFTDGRCCA